LRFIDTNVFVRYVTGDDARKQGATRSLFERLGRGDEDGFTSEAVVAEIFFVLTSRRHYGIDRLTAAALVRALLTMRGLRLPHRSEIERAVDVYEAYPRLDFEDALSVAHMEAQRLGEIVSYDRGFDRVGGITRVEP
jgi:predicted nucleic acid-binding protein